MPYPFGEYHQAFVPDFNAGAMENPGCVTLRDTLPLPRPGHPGRAGPAGRGGRPRDGPHVVRRPGHHALVGRPVAERVVRRVPGAPVLQRRRRSTRCGPSSASSARTGVPMADQSPSTHPVAGNDAADAETALQHFDGISYAKGAAVLKQLAAYLGDEVFLAGLRRYIAALRLGQRHVRRPDRRLGRGRARSTSGRGRRAWLRTAGMDTLDVLTSRIRADGAFVGAGARTGRRARTRSSWCSVDGRRRRSPQWPTSIAGRGSGAASTVPADSVLVVPDGTDAAWAKIRFGPDGWARLGQVLPAIADEPVQVVVVNAIRDARPRRRARPGRGAGPAPGRRPAGRTRSLVEAALGFAHEHAGRGVRPGRRAPGAARPGGAAWPTIC